MSWATFLLYSPPGLIPFAISALLVPLLCQGAVVFPPTSFLVTHLVLAGLTRSLLDLAAHLWLWRPVSPFLADAPSSLLGVRISEINYILQGQWQELNPFDIKEDVGASVKKIFDSLEVFLENTNITEVFQGLKPPRGNAWDEFVGMCKRSSETYNVSEALRNLAISESSKQYIDDVNVAVISLFEDVQVSSIFNTSRIPQNLLTSFDAVSEALLDLIKSLNFTEMLTGETVPPNLQDSLNSLGVSLETAGRNLNLTELYQTALSSNQEVFAQFMSFVKDPESIFQPEDMSAGTSWGGAVQSFLSSRPLFHFKIPAHHQIYTTHDDIFSNIFLLFVGIPLAFALGAALQDGCLWLVTRRYEYKIQSAQRSASGWMFVAATSGLMWAATDAFSDWALYGFLHDIGFLPAKLFLILLAHTLTAAPIRAVSQMRIAEAGARRDVLKDPKPGFISGFVWVTLTNSLYNMWWMSSSGILVVVLMNARFPVFCIIGTDAFVAACFVLWGRRVCRRVLKDEQRMIEDRERKRD